jgi:hypothetical protein
MIVEQHELFVCLVGIVRWLASFVEQYVEQQQDDTSEKGEHRCRRSLLPNSILNKQVLVIDAFSSP